MQKFILIVEHLAEEPEYLLGRNVPQARVSLLLGFRALRCQIKSFPGHKTHS